MILYTVDNEKPDGICLPTFAVDDFSRLLLHPCLKKKKSRSA